MLDGGVLLTVGVGVVVVVEEVAAAEIAANCFCCWYNTCCWRNWIDASKASVLMFVFLATLFRALPTASGNNGSLGGAMAVKDGSTTRSCVIEFDTSASFDPSIELCCNKHREYLLMNKPRTVTQKRNDLMRVL